MGIEASNDKLAASLGATPRLAARYGQLAGNLYAGAWGDSIEDVNTAIGSVKTSIQGVGSGNDLRSATIQALDFASIFEVDVVRATQVAGTAIRSGLAKDATQAFDLLVASSQRVPTQLRDDLLDATDEYGQFFASLGFSGEKAFSVLVEGAQKGTYGIDKAGDAIKEFTIRSTDMSTSSKAAYQAIGLDARTMANEVLAGGDDAQGALSKIVDGLLSIEDPADRANAAIGLFGTPIEDLNVRDIPAFLESLKGTASGLGDVEGASKRAGKALNDNGATDLTMLTREAKGLATGLAADAIPALRDLIDVIRPGVKMIGDLAQGFADLNPKTQSTIVKAAALATGIGAVVVVGGKLVTGTKAIAGGLASVRGAMGLTTTAAQNTTGAIGTSATKLDRLRSAARGAAGVGGLGLLAVGASTSNDAVKTLANVGGGALLGFSLAGPIGGAIGAGAGALLSLKQNADAAKAAAEAMTGTWEEYAATLDAVTGATTDQTRAMALSNLEQSGALDTLAGYGVSARQAVNASLGLASGSKAVADAVGQEEAMVGALVTQRERLRDAPIDSAADAEANSKQIAGIQAEIDAREQAIASIHNEIGAASDAVKARQAEIAATRDYSGLLGGLPKSIKTEVRANGLEPTRAAIADLANQYGLTPKQVKTLIKATGIDATVGQIKHVREELENTDQTRANLKNYADTTRKGAEVATDAARKGAAESRNALESVDKSGANLGGYVGDVSKGVGSARDTASRGSADVRANLERGPRDARGEPVGAHGVDHARARAGEVGRVVGRIPDRREPQVGDLVGILGHDYESGERRVGRRSRRDRRRERRR